MQPALRIETTVLPGHRVEVTAPQLPEGAKVEVTVALAEQPSLERVSLVDFLKSLPPGPRAFKTWEEYERFLQEEKNSWD
jgi:alpha-D-ribose 1-methylphosphonate 5-triphosphate diphosphatase PhnM